MNLLTLNYNRDNYFSIYENVFYELVKNVISNTKNVKLFDSRISLVDNKTNINIFVDIKILNKKSDDTENIFRLITQEIEKEVELLIDTKPKNIQICLLGYY
ncbi:hypothetical protein V2E24_01210 [Mycoplasmopsis ciconiae]|uniref:Uncharacterized protein n=1 Tax=Mycoplasmopsis ciconiae TaxID=561067 RepID=A0ABU7MKY7_9BACT|nr:hypothetical protein [Mycoplasmopsis ciconiae]